jgi:acyl dehydratase
MTGLLDRAGIFSGSVIPMLGARERQFRLPLVVGDTVRCEFKITSKRPTSRADSGIVGRRFTLVNDHDDVVQEGQLDEMMGLSPVERAFDEAARG